MLRKTTFLAAAVFFLLLIGSITVVNVHRPRIMVLHSYDETYIWTREVNKGLRRVLAFHDWIDVRFHEMKTKVHRSPEHLRRARARAHKAIASAKPDVLIAVDDNAQQLVARDYVGRDDIQIVYAGINGDINSYGYGGARNVTGIVERKPIGALKEILPLLTTPKPGAIRVLYLAERSSSTAKDAEQLARFQWLPIVYGGARLVRTFEDWKAVVEAAHEQADFLLVSGYQALVRDAAKEDDYMPPEEVMRWTETHSRIPLIGLNQFNAIDGAAFAIGVSPYEQGETTAGMAIRILNEGIAAGAIDDVSPVAYVVAMRQGAVKARKLKVPQFLRAFAMATDSYYP